MKNKKKLISLICAFCLVLCLGVFGVLAVTELNLAIGGEIKFSATGVKATISDGRFVTGTDTANLVDYSSVWQTGADTDKLDGFEVTTQKADYTAEIGKWSGLKLQFNEAGDSVYLYFTIKNNATDGSSIKLTLTNATQTAAGVNNVNTSIVLPDVDPIAPGITSNVFIEFKVDSKLIDAYLKDFAINIKLERTLVATVVEHASGSGYAPSGTEFSGADYQVVLYTIADGVATANGTGWGNSTTPKIMDVVVVDGVTYPVTKMSGFGFATEVTIPETVTDISACTFSSLKSLTVNGTVAFGDNQFSYSENLEKITINGVVTSIGSSIFRNYSDKHPAVSIVFPEGLVEVNDSAFEYSAVEYIKFPASLKTLGAYAFNCPYASTRTIVFEEGLETIEDEAFAWNGGILTPLTIPASVKNLGKTVFRGCYSFVEFKGSPTFTQFSADNTTEGTFAEVSSGFTIKMASATVPASFVGAFSKSQTAEIEIQVPAGAKSAYETAFNGFSNITITEYTA